MHLQEAVEPFDSFVRCIGLGPQTHLVTLRPRRAAARSLHAWSKDFVSAEEAQLLRDTTLTINAFFGWDFNSCEALRKDGIWHPIDFANPCPDSQVTSLHYHFPWLVKANLRWSIFCAVTKRPMRKTLDWEPFYEIAAERDMPYRERLRAYATIAEERFETARFEEFCAKHLPHLDEVAWEFFGTPTRARTRSAQKVAALFPAHEVEQFTELFWNASRRGARIAAGKAALMAHRGDKIVARWHSERVRARGDAGALGHRSASRCCCSRPPAATPRRSSASS